ncbi:class I SAM-dependent methyltransferase [Actinomadura yumaensis]|uniref:class I SAM-dependent methyltransferase n=1 Tax=Actinomadura yumaensis TaxID=111807 RepID=UPI0036212C57
MPQIVNTHQSEAWNGYEGRHWADHHDRYDQVNGGFNAALLDAAALTAEDRVLDLGCGNGQVTRLAARRARAATGIDLSGPMLDRARALAAEEGVANVTFERGDAQVHPLPESTAAISRFGVMFFADPVAAFANVARALVPGGRLAFLCMTALEGTELGSVLAAMGEHLPARPARTAPAPPRSPTPTGPAPSSPRRASPASAAPAWRPRASGDGTSPTPRPSWANGARSSTTATSPDRRPRPAPARRSPRRCARSSGRAPSACAAPPGSSRPAGDRVPASGARAAGAGRRRPPAGRGRHYDAG